MSAGQIKWVEKMSAKFAEISQQFTINWKKETAPRVTFVFSITNDYLQQEWESYKQVLKHRGHPQDSEDYFHGTKLSCTIDASKKLCRVGECGICGIADAGMDPNYIRKNSFQRFGKGFYLAPNSSKSHDYTKRNDYDSRALLLCHVLPGIKYPLSDRNQRLKKPPSGYDSVFGMVGSELNYPEIVVYDQRAVLPKYIIGYQ